MSGFPPASELNSAMAMAMRRPKWSLAAIIGFVLSLTFILAPLGILLGIVGIVRTWGGKRRGMGIAIASIPVGAITTGLLAFVIFFIYTFFLMARGAIDSTTFLETSRVALAESATEAYEGFSRRFQLAVDGSEFVEWANGVSARHGTLQSVERGNDASAYRALDDGSMEISMTGQFVNGPATISVIVAMDNDMAVEVFDIAVDGVSPRDSSSKQGDAKATDGDGE